MLYFLLVYLPQQFVCLDFVFLDSNSYLLINKRATPVTSWRTVYDRVPECLGKTQKIYGKENAREKVTIYDTDMGTEEERRGKYINLENKHP
jgi:hypothetical protein